MASASSARRRTASGGRDGVLDYGDHSGGHEPAGTDHPSGPGDLDHLHHAAGRADLDPPPRPGGLDLEPLDPTAGVHGDLDPIALRHRTILGPGRTEGAAVNWPGHGHRDPPDR